MDRARSITIKKVPIKETNKIKSSNVSKVTENNNYLIIDKSATATIENFQNRTKPSYMGPGTWDVIHKKAFKAWSKEDQMDFCVFMREVCTEFNCLECRGHCEKYIEMHPPENLIGKLITHNGKQLPLSMFAWTWKFHNAVSARIGNGKPIMKWETAYDIYSTNEISECSEECKAAAHDDEKSREILEVPAPVKPFKTIGRRAVNGP